MSKLNPKEFHNPLLTTDKYVNELQAAAATRPQRTVPDKLGFPQHAYPPRQADHPGGLFSRRRK